MLNNIKFHIDFEFGYLGDRCMAVEINGTKVLASKGKTVTHSIDISLPADVELVFSGKNTNDTIIDQQGQIIKDMYVKILNIRLDQIVLPDWVIASKLRLITDKNEIINTAYIGFNGKITIPLNQNTVFSQYQNFLKI